MKPVVFDYLVPGSPAETIEALNNRSGDTKLVAGAQSLGPMLNLRLARPRQLVDVSMLPRLRESRETGDSVTFGAAVTHAEIEDGEVPDPTPGWLRAAAANIAHRAVRNRGTLGGSLAHADPAADWPVVMLCLGARVVLEGPDGLREMAVADFLAGPFETRLAPGEFIVSVRVPRPARGARWAYAKFTRQVGEFAKASAAVLIGSEDDAPRIAVGALASQPSLVEAAMARRLVAGTADAADAIIDLLPNSPPAGRALHVATLRNALREIGADAKQE